MFSRHFIVPVALVALVLAGCGSNEARDPKQTLSEKEQKQVKELQQQRQDEWGGTGKKKK